MVTSLVYNVGGNRIASVGNRVDVDKLLEDNGIDLHRKVENQNGDTYWHIKCIGESCNSGENGKRNDSTIIQFADGKTIYKCQHEQSCDIKSFGHFKMKLGLHLGSYRVGDPKWTSSNGSRWGQPQLMAGGHQPPPFEMTTTPISAFLQEKFDLTFLVSNLLVSGQTMILAGQSKTLKSSISFDLGISLATGTPFLGHFDVPDPQPVTILSAESGRAALIKLAQRIYVQKNLPFKKDVPLHFGEELPALTIPDHLEAMEKHIEKYGTKLLILDPTYLSLLKAAPLNTQTGIVFQMGQLLKPYGDLGAKHGCVMCLVHHNTKQGAKEFNRLPTLEDISGAGFGEFARQWILLRRRSAYIPKEGEHKLWMVTGGSAGHAGQFTVDVEEGPASDDLDNRRWVPRVAEFYDIEDIKNADNDISNMKKRDEILQVARELELQEKHITAYAIRSRIGGRHDKLESTLMAMVQDGELDFNELTRGDTIVKQYFIRKLPWE